MTERVSEFGTSVVVPLEERDIAHRTAGEMLREAREAHGLQIEVVAAALKVPVHRLAALEADDMAALPDPVFARALAGSVCRALRIDPLPVLAKLPGAKRDALTVADRTIRTNIVSGTPRWNGRSGGRPSRALLLIVLLLLVGAAALFWLPQPTLDRLSASVARLAARGQAQAGAPQQSAVEPAIAAAPAAGAEPGAEAPPQSASPVAAVPPMQGAQGALPVGPSAAAAAAATASADPSAAANSAQTLVFVARDACWITVTDTAGKQLLHRTVVAGETVGLSSTLALSVVVGRASSVDVQVRGKPFDLTPMTRNGGVARFEVKTS